MPGGAARPGRFIIGRARARRFAARAGRSYRGRSRRVRAIKSRVKISTPTLSRVYYLVNITNVLYILLYKFIISAAVRRRRTRLKVCVCVFVFYWRE